MITNVDSCFPQQTQSISFIDSSPHQLVFILHHSFVWRQTRRQILNLPPPVRLVLAKIQNQLPPFSEEVVPDPVLAIRFSVQSGALDVDIPVARIKVHIPDPSDFPCDRRGDIDGFEEGRGDQVDVLAGVWEEAEHAEGDERAHGAGIVVARSACLLVSIWRKQRTVLAIPYRRAWSERSGGSGLSVSL
jgi:hypothetical protein